jgi:hypothetical protein
LRTRGESLVLLHNGSTVAWFSSVVYWYEKSRCAIAVLMNIDAGDESCPTQDEPGEGISFQRKMSLKGSFGKLRIANQRAAGREVE